MPVPQDAVPELQMPVPQEIDLAVPEVTLPKGLRYVSDNFKQEFSIGYSRCEYSKTDPRTISHLQRLHSENSKWSEWLMLS